MELRSQITSAFFASPKQLGRNTEDKALAIVDGDGAIVAVADGIGGRPNGARAAAIAIEMLEKQWNDRRDKTDASVFSDIVRRLQDEEGEGHSDGMGTTLTFAIYTASRLLVMHVGDCVVYHLREKGIVRLTRPQTEFEQLVEQGVFDRSFEEKYPRRNVLTSALTGEGNYTVFERSTLTQPGDRFVVASDGVSKMMTPTNLRDISLSCDNPQNFADKIREYVLEKGPRDDFSASILFV